MLQYSDLLNFNWTPKEMNRFLLTFLSLNIGLFLLPSLLKQTHFKRNKNITALDLISIKVCLK